jgi:hypothetical protein
LNSALNHKQNGILNVHIWPKIVVKEFGQVGQNMSKSGQTLEKVHSLGAYVFTQTNMIF